MSSGKKKADGRCEGKCVWGRGVKDMDKKTECELVMFYVLC